MAEVQIFSPAELPRVFGVFADKLGGQVYRDGEIDGFTITREITPRYGDFETYVKFGVERLREGPNAPVMAVQYAFEQGTSTKLEKFSKQVNAYLAELNIMIDPEQVVWEEEVETYSFAEDYEDDERVIVATKDMRYGAGRQHLLEVPILDGEPIFTELDALDPPAELKPVHCTPDITVVEYTQGISVMAAENLDDFDTIIASFTANRAEACIQRMSTMMLMLTPD